MLISFDLDETLICQSPDVPTEPKRVPRVLQSFFGEPLCLGFCELYQTLGKQGWEICIYTTSFRPVWQIRGWLWFHGIRVAQIINQERHQAIVGKTIQPCPSKHPPSFGIRLHVDDSELVALEAKRYGFRVVIVCPSDPDWAEAVLNAANQVKKL